MSARLSQRELQCLRLAATMTDKEIARDLALSPKTVSQHVSSAMRKLGAPNRRAALRALGENPLPEPTRISAGPAMAFPAPATGVVPTAGGDEVRPDDAAPFRLHPVPAGLGARLLWIGAFALVAAVIATGGVSVVGGIFDLVARFAPPTAS